MNLVESAVPVAVVFVICLHSKFILKTYFVLSMFSV